MPSVFLSYSHEDEVWKESLKTHLGVLESQGLLDTWDDRRIAPGAAWFEEIQNAIARASVAVLLISADFLNSKFIIGEEIPRLLQRQRSEGLPVIPVIVRPCAWQAVSWLSELQVRPPDGQPLSRFRGNRRATELAKIASEIIASLKISVGSELPAASASAEEKPPRADERGSGKLIDTEEAEIVKAIPESEISLPDTWESIREVSIRIASTGDLPAVEDSLGFEPYVEAVAEFLVNDETRPPLTLSIEGEWGSGKSSFMLQLEKALKHRSRALLSRLVDAWDDEDEEKDRRKRLWSEISKSLSWCRSIPSRLAEAWSGKWTGRGHRLWRELQLPCCLTVRFNAWRHDKEDALWAAFASEFLRRIAPQRFFLRRWLGHLRLFFVRFRWKNGWLEMLRALALWTLLLFLGLVVPIAATKAWPSWSADIESRLQKIGVEETKSIKKTPQQTPTAGTPSTGGNQSGGGPEQKEDDRPIFTWLVGLGGLGAYAAGVISLALKLKGVVGNPLEINLRKYLQSPDYEGHVAFVESFHEDFRRIVDAYGGKRKVYVFIDDLDRCEVPKAADLMQALNLLITDDQRLVFIIGMDRAKIAAGLAVKYEKLLPYLVQNGVDEKGNVDPQFGLDYGYTFIEKFVQLPFRVPNPKLDNLRQFLSTMSGSPGTPLSNPVDRSSLPPQSVGSEKPQEPLPGTSKLAEQAERREKLSVKLRGDSLEVEEAALIAAPALDNNPRRLKQFVNLFRLRAYIASETGAFVGVTFSQLAKFVAISLAWPGLLTDFVEKPDLLPALQRVALGEDKEASAWEKRPGGRWFNQPALIALLRQGCDVHRVLPLPPDPYNLAHADLELLLSVSPRVERKPLSLSTKPPVQ